MSIENLKKFVKLCEDDETIREKVKKIGVDKHSDVIKYAADEFNLDFNADDLSVLAEEHGLLEDELSEKDLEKIAGGVVTTTAAVVGALAILVGFLVVGVVTAAVGSSNKS